MSEIEKKESQNAHPSELVAALCGGDKINLGGFGAVHMPNSWVRPGVRFVSAHETPASEAMEANSRGKILSSIRMMTAGLLFVAGIGLGAWIGAYSPDQSAIKSWSVVSVGIEGVQINKDGKMESVLVGNILPNGEILMATLPDQQAYSTNKSTSALNLEKTTNKATQ